MPIPRNLTVKTQEALENAHSLAQNEGQQELSPLHLLVSLLGQTDSIVIPLLQKLEIDINKLKTDLKTQLNKLTQVKGAPVDQIYPSKELIRVLEASADEAKKMEDSFVSVEHLFLSLITVGSGAQKILIDAGLDYPKIKQTLEKLRGPHNVTDENPEDKYQALEKYGIDLTKKASDVVCALSEITAPARNGRPETTREISSTFSRLTDMLHLCS